MPTLAPGSPELTASSQSGQVLTHGGGYLQRHLGQYGFTLLELLVVVTIVALATAGVSLSLRDASATQLEREAQRLAALFESARANARTLGVPIVWEAGPRGFELNGEFRAWLAEGTVAGQTRMALGPEPLMPPQRLSLSLQGRTLWLNTDGLRPFTVDNTPAPTSAQPSP